MPSHTATLAAQGRARAHSVPLCSLGGRIPLGSQSYLSPPHCQGHSHTVPTIFARRLHLTSCSTLGSCDPSAGTACVAQGVASTFTLTGPHVA